MYWALCLSCLECDHHASSYPGEADGHEDKHKAPTHPHIRPLSLQDGSERFRSLPYSVVKHHQDQDRRMIEFDW